MGSAAWLLLVSLPAAPQHPQGGPRFGRPGAARPAPPQQVPARDAGLQNQNPQRDPRMTPQERRQLRRDVHDHGRDIYRGRGVNRP